MKNILLLLTALFISSIAIGQTRLGDYDVSIHAKEVLEIDADSVVVQDTSTFPLDMSYIRWSADGAVFRKNYILGDTWMEHSNTSKTSFDTIRFALNLWEVSGDTVKLVDDKIVYNDTIIGDYVQSIVYFLGTDTLSLTNMYSDDGVDGYVLTRDGSTAIWQPSATGNRNTARNVGIAGYGVFQDSLSSELQFRNIASADTFINFSLSDSTIYATWDGEGRNIIAGTGLIGTGNLASDVTINLYIPELVEATEDIDNTDWFPFYDQSTSQHKKVHPDALLPDLEVNSTTAQLNFGTLNLIAGDNVTLTDLGGGSVLIESSSTGFLPTCTEGEFLAYIGGDWTCVNVCDYICEDTIIRIINDYIDTVPDYIAPSGDVTINFSRLDCEDSTQVTAAMLAKETLNLTTIKITTVPTVGELHYGGVLVTAGQELTVVSGAFESALYYVSDDGTGSSYADLFTFQLLYSSNQDYLGAANVNVSVSTCVTDAVCFGYLYNWFAVDDVRELTSSADWVVPDYGFDWFDLKVHLGGGTVAGGKLKITGTVFWNSPNIATNDVGFNAKGSGARDENGIFNASREAATYWSSQQSSSTFAYHSGTIVHESVSMSSNIDLKEKGHPVRLVKDATGLADGVTTTYTGNDGKVYNAIVINELYWTTEDLEETKYRDGTLISNVTDNTAWSNLTTGAWCVYENNDGYKCK